MPRKKIGSIKEFNLNYFYLNLCFLNVSIPFVNISETIVKVKLIFDGDRQVEYKTREKKKRK